VGPEWSGSLSREVSAASARRSLSISPAQQLVEASLDVAAYLIEHWVAVLACRWGRTVIVTSS
jgi:hypothetical protein